MSQLSSTRSFWLASFGLIILILVQIGCSSPTGSDTKRAMAAIAEVRATSEAINSRLTSMAEETDEEREAQYQQIKDYVQELKSTGQLHETPAHTYVVPIHAVKLMDDDGRREADISPDQMTRLVNKTNEIYNNTGIQFSFDPDPKGPNWSEVKDTVLNNMSSDDNTLRYAKFKAEEYPKDQAVVFFRNGQGKSPEQDAFSGPFMNFVVMPGYSQATSIVSKDKSGRWVTQQANFVMAHELGHYLGLLHTFPGPYDGYTSSPLKAAAFIWYSGGTVDALDGDLLSDTPPEAGFSYYILQGWDPCTGHDSYTISETIRGVKYDWEFAPDRSNIMSYFPCEPLHLTEQQIQVMHRTLERRGFAAAG